MFAMKLAENLGKDSIFRDDNGKVSSFYCYVVNSYFLKIAPIAQDKFISL